MSDFFRTHGGWLAKVFALVGGLVYTVQSWVYSHTLDSVLDEGAYLLKGLLFVRGVYAPFQDYGPLTNHMPLSFIIHGLVQAMSPGLRSSRAFVVVLGVLILIGLWLTVRRLRGEWWAGGAVWVLALNPAVIKMYSLATSQVLIACMLIWMLALTLGKGRPLWQLVLGAALAGVSVMSRINLAPVLPIILLYVFWQHGRRAGMWASAAGIGVTLIGHVIYWPEVLKIWTYWLPDALTPFLDPWREPEAVRYWDSNLGLQSRVISFFEAFRFHFVTLVSALGAWILWPKEWGVARLLRLRGCLWSSQTNSAQDAPTQLNSVQDYRIVVILSALFLILALMHGYASIGLSYCIFCFGIYLSFFDIIGVIILILVLPYLSRKIGWFRQAVIALLILVLLPGMGFSAFSEYKWFGEEVLKSDVPRLRSFQILPGSIRLWAMLENRFGWDYDPQLRYSTAAFGLIIALSVILIAFVIIPLTLKLLRTAPSSRPSPGGVALTITLLAGLMLSPTLALGRGFQTYDCNQAQNELALPGEETTLDTIPTLDVIQSYEAAGHYLASVIPNGSTVFWRGSLSAVPLLYLGEVRFFPSQINQDYTLYLTGDDAELERYGFWSHTLAQRWLAESDYVLIADRYYEDWLKDAVSTPEFRELQPTLPVAPCNPRSFIHVFARISLTPTPLPQGEGSWTFSVYR